MPLSAILFLDGSTAPILWSITVLAFCVFWIYQFVGLMLLSDADFPGRFDKPVWAAASSCCSSSRRLLSPGGSTPTRRCGDDAGRPTPATAVI